MNNYGHTFFNPAFSHIYIEEKAADCVETKAVLSKFPHARRIVVRHYKDVFCRSHQEFSLQKKSPNLILAKRDTRCLYEGAKPCQDFGFSHFYYISSVMNCVYDCEYCYLQGMYPSANLVVYVNLQEEFRQVEEKLKQHPLYLCISFDTDLLAMEPVLGYVRQWITFAREHEGLTIEVRTKSANYQQIADIPPLERVILAWSLSPQEIVQRYEHKTASLPARLDNAAQAVQDGWKIRLCFDPVIIQKGWETSYRKLVQQTFQKIPAQGVLDVGIGTFRVAKDALKRMRKGRMESALLHYPYTLDGGVYQYDRQVRQKVLGNMRTWLQEYLPEKIIYEWQEEA